MATAISSIFPGQQIHQSLKAATAKPKAKAAAAQPKDVTVTISARGRQAAQQHALYSPTEEMNESYGEQISEAEAGMK